MEKFGYVDGIFSYIPDAKAIRRNGADKLRIPKQIEKKVLAIYLIGVYNDDIRYLARVFANERRQLVETCQ